MVDALDCVAISGLIVAVFVYYNRVKLADWLLEDDEDITVASSGCRVLVDVFHDNNKDYLVVFGSQTGTAEEYAKKFSKELKTKFGLNVMCVDIDNYDFDTLNQLPTGTFVSFFISTYGEGDFPDTAVGLDTFLSSADPESLNKLKFTIFGLGNSTYEFFNGASKRALKGLVDAGATHIGKFGMADDGFGTTDEDYLSWKDEILDILKAEGDFKVTNSKWKPSFILQKLNELNDKVSLGEPSLQYLPSSKLPTTSEGIQTGPFDLSYPYVAPIVKTQELFSLGNERNCVHVEIDVSKSNLKYSTGDHLGIWPSNPLEEVDKFLTAFNLESGNQVFKLKANDHTLKLPFPIVPTTIRSAVQHYLEITGPISRDLFTQLIQFAPNLDIKNTIDKLSKDKELFAKEITSKYFNLADALLELSNGKPWTKVPWEFLCESIPKLQPRYYSISSSAISEKQTIHITAIVEKSFNPINSKPILGVTTNLLHNIEVEQNNSQDNLITHYDLDGPRGLYSNYKLPVYVRKSTFRLPTNPSTPVIMIGPGTGVAPFRGFIRERVAMLKNEPNIKFGKQLLFYGSRNEDDYLYKNEWPKYSESLGNTFEMIVCHSRLPGSKKVYVQDKLNENRQEVLKLLDAGAFIYICGDAKHMARDVNKVLTDILQSKGMNEEEATNVLKTFRTSGRYQEDVW
ncbi:hypothetical protein TBLA_0C03210 [Henningerozyma blattae CBS 6284]|uniref:NADPH--cytochrome P450 reductase n=1 Tax=Henningerozyma blattae (strain ATCC 34711 / CBS 6284 / DSM 70876 / NBRC 10599 / NRRL Y-10934 / UCD 77-7) TaxID=1071380 RepID=I2H173_HENB6|nr:hypothetical protein TBLA_0C03210 [Tetrapisispora blattae CBS 6284]CCH60125.1 hypothetical protein TBLA_0C03210 [Tetrapisispora blattae CBS 6284]